MKPSLRYLAALFFAGWVALGLFWLMTSLTSRGNAEFAAVGKQTLMNFIRIDETQTPVQRRQRERPQPPDKIEPAPPMPVLPAPRSPSPRTPQIDVPVAQFRPDLAVSGIPFAAPVEPSGPTAPTGPVAYSQALTPVSQVPPVYPRRALMDGITGWVRLNFVINADGSVSGVKVVEANPRRGIFDHEAIRALSRWRFRPQIENGQAVPAVATITINFSLDR